MRGVRRENRRRGMLRTRPPRLSTKARNSCAPSAADENKSTPAVIAVIRNGFAP
ncbi:MAG: hypothetical protein MI923_00845 [Phycisphaerales bacterium]|nr:hypothetical protein [Phycisphaerales bacterium]